MMKRPFVSLVALWLALTASADRVVVFNCADIWPVSVDMETSFGPMPTGYYLISQDDVEVEFNMNDEMENAHDAYYYRGKMNIYSSRYGIKMISFNYRQMDDDAFFTLLYESNYNYLQTTLAQDEMDGWKTTVFEFVGTYRKYVGFEGKADILTIAVTLDDEDPTNLEEAVTARKVDRVRYFNAAGQEMQQPMGVTIRLTTFTDGSTAVEKQVY